MSRNKLKNSEFCAVILHDIIREICLKSTFNQAFSIVCRRSFCISEGFSKTNFLKIKLSFFQQVADILYELDKQEKVVSSCYSIALTIFYIAATQNLSPYLTIGVNKVDKKLLGHAWVELSEGNVINPGREKIANMSVMHKWQIKDGLDKWLRNRL